VPNHLRRRLAALLLCGALPLTLCSCAEQSVSQELGDSSDWSSLESVGNSSKLDSSSNSTNLGIDSNSSSLDDFGNSSELEAIDNSSSMVDNGNSSDVEESSNRQDDPSVPAVASFQTAPGQEETNQTQRPVESAGTYTVLTPSASGTVVYSGGGAQIDASNASEGYIMVRYDGDVSKIRVQLTRDGGSTYTYGLRSSGVYDVFPLSQGSGGYTVNVFENVYDNQYALVMGQYISANLRSSVLPFLYPNQYVNFYDGCQTVSKGARLASTAANDLEVVENIYNYVIHNITYDFNKAETVSFGYLPNVDTILNSGTGICFDYAAVMTAMLRTQNIPTKLVVGYAGPIYHAWISTYITDIGWVNGIIYFDGQSWVRMDPTFASSGNESGDIMNYIGDGSNYNAMYVY